MYVDLKAPSGSFGTTINGMNLSVSDTVGVNRVDFDADTGSGFMHYNSVVVAAGPGITNSTIPVTYPASSGQVMAHVIDFVGNSTAVGPVSITVNKYFTNARWITQSGNYVNTAQAPQNAQYVAGDFNGDGRCDIARVFNDGGYASIDVFLSQANNTFVMQRWVSRQGGYWATQKWVAGDFTGDGRCDLACIFNDGGYASIDVHASAVVNGANTFNIQRWATQQGGFWDAQKWIAGDFTGDHKCDIANVFADGPSGLGSIDVHASTGTSFGILRWETQQFSFSSAQAWMASDFTNDGRCDLLCAFNDNGQVSADVHQASANANGFLKTRWMTQSGVFDSSVYFLAGKFHGVAAGDFGYVHNESGLASFDIYSNAASTFTLELWAHNQGQFIPNGTVGQAWLSGDFNGDGKCDVANVFNDNSLTSIDVHGNIH